MTQKTAIAEVGRKLSRNETHDLGMIIKDRTKVLKAHAEEQAAACMADFEKNLAKIYAWDSNEIWRKATEEATKAIVEANKKIASQCKKMGIPETFAPGLSISWQGRGENALAQRRTELRRVAKTSIEAMTKAAITKIEKQALDLRTQIVGMGLYTPEAKMFLESLAPVEDAMQALSFVEIERRLETERQNRLSDQRRYGS